MRDQDRAGHGIQVVTPITKRSKKQVGMLFVDDTNPWEGLDEDNGIGTVMEKARAVSTCEAATCSQWEMSCDPTSAHIRSVR